MQSSAGAFHQQKRSTRSSLRSLLASTAWAGFFGLAGNAFCEAAATNSDADPAVAMMLEKGMITEDEASKVQAQIDARRTNQLARFPETKWKMSDAIKSIEVFGDLRLRYEGRSATDPSGGHIDLNRMRYAVRLGLRGDLFDDFYWGFRMETSANPRSSFTTFGNNATGPFGKSTAGLNVGQLYLGWRPEDWVEVTVGKMPNPLYTTSLVWSPSLNPEGAAEHFKYTVGQADFFAIFGQFLYQDTNPNSTSSGYFNALNVNSANLPFLLAWQGGVNFHLTKKVSFKVAPVIYTYLQVGSHGPATSYSPDYAGTYVGQGQPQGQNANAYYNLLAPGQTGGYDLFAANQTGINNLLVLEMPFEVNVKLKNIDLRLFGDYAQNLDGGARANAAYHVANTYFTTSGSGYPLFGIATPQTHDNVAYQVGLAVGSTDGLGLVNGTTAKRHAWEFRTYWQHIEQYALDPNLIDTDFFEGVENMEGIYFAAAYGFTGNLIGTVRYGRASRINSKLGTGGSGQDIPQMNPIDHFDLFQADLTFKF